MKKQNGIDSEEDPDNFLPPDPEPYKKNVKLSDCFRQSENSDP